MDDALRARVEGLQAAILVRFPETRFKLQVGDQEDIWHLSVYTPDGKIQIPREVTNGLNQIWQDHKISIITVVYPMFLYEEES